MRSWVLKTLPSLQQFVDACPTCPSTLPDVASKSAEALKRIKAWKALHEELLTLRVHFIKASVMIDLDVVKTKWAGLVPPGSTPEEEQAYIAKMIELKLSEATSKFETSSCNRQ